MTPQRTPPATSAARPFPTVVLALALACASTAGCRQPAPPAGGKTGQATAKQGSEQRDSSQPKKAPATEPKEEASPLIKPLKVRRLERDPRSVVERLQDADAEFRRNQEGNIRALRLETADPELLAELERLVDVESLAIQDAGEQLEAEMLQNLLSELKLRSLELHGRSITSQHLSSISSQDQLRLLRLSGTRVDDRLLDSLRSLPRLERLELSWSRVTDEGVKRLAEMDSLTTLDLGFTEVTDESLRSLAKMTSLKTLVLSGTSISAAASRELREALPEARIIGLPSDGELPPPPPDPNEPPPGLIAT